MGLYVCGCESCEREFSSRRKETDVQTDDALEDLQEFPVRLVGGICVRRECWEMRAVKETS